MPIPKRAVPPAAFSPFADRKIPTPPRSPLQRVQLTATTSTRNPLQLRKTTTPVPAPTLPRFPQTAISPLPLQQIKSVARQVAIAIPPQRRVSQPIQRASASASSSSSSTPSSLRRSNSMSETHSADGGVRSRARLAIGSTPPKYSKMWVAEGKNEVSVGTPTRDDFHAPVGSIQTTKMSANDAEAYVINEIENDWNKLVRNMKKGETAYLEFHGNHGPCSGCQSRIDSFVARLNIVVPFGATLHASVFYTQLRGPGRGGTDFYGYEEKSVTASAYTYGPNSAEVLHQYKFPSKTNTTKPPKPKPAAKAATVSGSYYDFGDGSDGDEGEGSEHD